MPARVDGGAARCVACWWYRPQGEPRSARAALACGLAERPRGRARRWCCSGTRGRPGRTVLLNLMRAAGSASPAWRISATIRPPLSRCGAPTPAICAHCAYRSRDPMNDDPAYRRVAVRRTVLPLLADVAGRDLVPVLARQADVLQRSSSSTSSRSRRGQAAAPVRVLRDLPGARAARASVAGPPPPSRPRWLAPGVARRRSRQARRWAPCDGPAGGCSSSRQVPPVVNTLTSVAWWSAKTAPRPHRQLGKEITSDYAGRPPLLVGCSRARSCS
jgi:hypothetical protein